MTSSSRRTVSASKLQGFEPDKCAAPISRCLLQSVQRARRGACCLNRVPGRYDQGGSYVPIGAHLNVNRLIERMGTIRGGIDARQILIQHETVGSVLQLDSTDGKSRAGRSD